MSGRLSETSDVARMIDMAVRNDMSRYHLALEAVRRASPMTGQAAALVAHCQAMPARHPTWIREHLEDMPEVGEWKWTGT